MYFVINLLIKKEHNFHFVFVATFLNKLQVDRFAGVMSDLGLHGFMLKAREFEEMGTDIIFIDPTTGNIGEISRNFLHNKKGEQFDINHAGIVEDDQKKELIELVRTLLFDKKE